MTTFQIDTESLLNRFLSYVQIDSETTHEGTFAKRLVEDFEKIGLTVTTDDLGGRLPTDGFNIYATLPGDDKLEPILFSSHMDTVTPGQGIKPKVCEDGYVRSDGTTILGGDDKAGICAIMEGLAKATHLPRRPTVEVAITVMEEGGLFGSKNLDYSRITAKKAVVFDSGGGPDSIITSAPGQTRVVAKILGKRAHAGIAPETGVSAIIVAAQAVSAMKLLRIDEETTSNIGKFIADGPTNIVSPEVTLELEVRSRNTEKLQKHTQHLVDCLETACKSSGAQLECKVDTSYLGYQHDDSHPWVSLITSTVAGMGLQPATQGTGGGSDANIFNENGIVTLNMGVGMENVHTTEEQQNIQHMNQGAEFCYQLIKKIGES